MSRYTFNGRPVGYFQLVMQEHAERCAEAVAAGVITQEQAEEFRRDALPPAEDELSSNGGRKYLPPRQRRKLNKLLAVDPAHKGDTEALPPRAVRRRQITDQGRVLALGCSKREAWTLYQLTKGRQ